MQDLLNQNHRNLARITGMMYLLVIIFAGFSQGYVRESLVVPGDALATALNIMNNQGLFRLGFVADILAFLLDAAISIMFYQLLKPAGKTLAIISSVFRILAHPAIGSLNLLNHFMALQILGGVEFMSAFTPEQIHVIALELMDAHRIGYLIAGAFFGVHCFLLGILLHKSKLIPELFGILMIFAAVGYLMESFGDFLFPGNEELLAWIVGLSAGLGEVGLTLYLLIKGVRKSAIVLPVQN
ncbi:MAG: DUF4386 domain-containing protein [Bacteroidota bacterium]